MSVTLTLKGIPEYYYSTPYEDGDLVYFPEADCVFMKHYTGEWKRIVGEVTHDVPQATCLTPLNMIRSRGFAERKRIVGEVTPDVAHMTQHRFDPCFLEFLHIIRSRGTGKGAGIANCMPRGWNKIKKVIFNAPATIVFWQDDTKTIVKCGDNEPYDPEKGLMAAITKKTFGNLGNYYNQIKKWLPENTKVEKPHGDTIGGDENVDDSSSD